MLHHPFAVVDAADADAVGTAAASVRELGAAVVTGAVDLAACDDLLAVMLAELDAAALTPPALGTPGHVQHCPPPRAAHLHPTVFANPSATAVATALLGDPIHLSLYTGNTMLPGTERAQPLHWDEPQLWPGLDAAAPPHSLTVNIPLVDVTLDNGAIELWPGTHLDTRSGARAGEGLHVPDDWVEARRAEVPPVRVPAPRGSLLLRDARLWHRGTTNSTDRPRPMVAVVYSAWWFRPFAIDFFPDAEPVLKASGLRVTPRYREDFDHLVWPPDWRLVPRPVDAPA